MNEHYQIWATRTELEEIGISYNLTGKVGILIKKFPDDYYALLVTSIIDGMKFDNIFDIPSKWLTKITNEDAQVYKDLENG